MFHFLNQVLLWVWQLPPCTSSFCHSPAYQVRWLHSEENFHFIMWWNPKGDQWQSLSFPVLFQPWQRHIPSKEKMQDAPMKSPWTFPAQQQTPPSLHWQVPTKKLCAPATALCPMPEMHRMPHQHINGKGKWQVRCTWAICRKQTSRMVWMPSLQCCHYWWSFYFTL